MLLRRAGLNGILITENGVRFFIPGHLVAIKLDDGDEIVCHPPPQFGVVRRIGPIPTN